MYSNSPATSEGASPNAIGNVQLDTTVKSIVHWLAFGKPVARRRLTLALSVKVYLWTAVAAYGAMLVAGLVGSVSMTAPSSTISLPFLRDWNTAYLFLMSFPTVVMFTLSDDAALRLALARVQEDRIVTVDRIEAQSLQRRWTKQFGRINIAGQTIGVVIGILIAIANYRAYVDPVVGFWIADNGRLLPIGVVFVAAVFLFYAIIPFYIIRTVSMSVLLADIVRRGRIQMMPFHPDKCGGLRPVGTLGLRNQYALTVFGVNVVLFASITMFQLGRPSTLVALVTLAVVAYVIAGPVVFLGPLLPFRGGMLKTKSELLGEVAQRLRIELLRLREQLSAGPITREDEELIDRLRKVGAVIDELPVWPFDAGTLRRFITAYLVPVVGALTYPLATAILEVVLKRMP